MMFKRGDSDRLTGLGGAVQSFDYPHILLPFFARRFRYPIVKDAIGKVEKFRGELVALTGFVRGLFTVDNELRA
jgi:hypothetical protein